MAKLIVTTRELLTVELVSHGLSNLEIATRMRITEQGVKNILHRLMKRHGLRNRAEVAVKGVSNVFGKK